MSVSFDDLEDSEGHDSLDAKIGAEIIRLATQELDQGSIHYLLANDIMHHAEVALKTGRSLKGRQGLKLIHNHNQRDEEHGHSYDVEDMDRVQFTTDAQLPQLFSMWNHRADRSVRVVGCFQVPQPNLTNPKMCSQISGGSRCHGGCISLFSCPLQALSMNWWYSLLQ